MSDISNNETIELDNNNNNHLSKFPAIKKFIQPQCEGQAMSETMMSTRAEFQHCELKQNDTVLPWHKLCTGNNDACSCWGLTTITRCSTSAC